MSEGHVLKKTIVAETLTTSSKMKYKQTVYHGKNRAHQCRWYSSLTQSAVLTYNCWSTKNTCIIYSNISFKFLISSFVTF